MKSQKITFSKLKVGQAIKFSHTIQQNDIQLFANLCGDYNPLHLKNSFAKKMGFKDQVAHGMLAASLISKTVGMYFPGQYGVIISQSLNYKHPIYINAPLQIESTITEKHPSIQLIALKTLIYDSGKKICIEGDTKVKVLR